MPNAATVVQRPDINPTPAAPAAEAQGWVERAQETVTGSEFLTIAALILTVGLLWYLARKAKNLAKTDRPDDKLATIGMLIGLGWSGEAMWIIGTKLLDVPWPVMIVLLFALEVNLSVAMIRAVRHHREHNHPGRYGQTAWTIAASIALIAAFASHSIAEVALRVAVPLLVTKTWWDGLTANDAARKAAGISSWRWTPRRLLLWLGAIEPGERDAETIDRDRLTKQMTRLYYLTLHGSKRLKSGRKTKLAKLTLTADDEIIREVQRRVARTSWTTAELLPYTPTNPSPTTGDEPGDETTDAAPVRQTPAATPRQNKRVDLPPTRRIKAPSRAATSGDARRDDPATEAAWLVVTQGLSNQKAADRVGGTSEPSVRRRVKTIREGLADGTIQPPVTTPISEPKESVTTGVNGHSLTHSEETK